MCRKRALQQIRTRILQHPSAITFTALFFFLLFVLYITNKKPSSHQSHDVFNHDHTHDYSSFHYAVIIDCGSSGSRVYIYYWPPHTGRSHDLLAIRPMTEEDGTSVQMKVKPGISSFADNPSNSSDSIKALLKFATAKVPKAKHKETPLYLLATAGMRLLPKTKQDAIMKEILSAIPRSCNFHFTKSHAEVITGKQEGIYLWIATNYVLGRFDHSHDSIKPTSMSAHDAQRKQTVGTIEIGGASVQIAYEVPANRTLHPDLSAEINLGCDLHQTMHRYQVYVSTFLGYGTNAARKRYEEKLAVQQAAVPSEQPLLDPCLSRDIQLNESYYNNTPLHISGTGDFAACALSLRSLLNQSQACARRPCSLNGVHQSEIAFERAEFYGFAEFWYSSNDVWTLGGAYNHDRLEKSAKDFCARKWHLHKHHYALGFYPKADTTRFKYQCFKAAWMMTVLHDGFHFPTTFEQLTTAQVIHGREVQWTLGALLYRTRFMPLRDMNVGSAHHSKALQHGAMLSVVMRHGYYAILLACVLSVIVGVTYYYRRMQRLNVSSKYLHRKFKDLNTNTMASLINMEFSA